MTDQPRIWPADLTPALRGALSLMLWDSGAIAGAFRAAGHDIKRRAEDGQAFVLHWAAGLALEHGEGWRTVAGKQLVEMRRAAEAKGNPDA